MAWLGVHKLQLQYYRGRKEIIHHLLLISTFIYRLPLASFLPSMNVLHPVYSKCTILHCQCIHEAIHITCDSSYPSTPCHTHDSGNSAGRHCLQGGIAGREALLAGRHCLQGGIACREALPAAGRHCLQGGIAGREALPAGRHCLQLRWLHPTNCYALTGLSQTGVARLSRSPRSRGSLPKGGLPSSVLYKIGKSTNPADAPKLNSLALPYWY